LNGTTVRSILDKVWEMAAPGDLSSGWKTYEVYHRDGTTPFSNELATGGTTPVQPITKMRLVQELGWPEAKRLLKDGRGRPLVVKKLDPIWLLKCTPTCWRLYFYVYENGADKRLIYLHAVCKKTDKEDPRDAAEAKRIYDEIRARRSATALFEFPPE
jgi:hypothetical protein